MAQWGGTDTAANSVQWAAQWLSQGAGATAKAANNTALYNNVNAEAFVDVPSPYTVVVGQFMASANAMANTSGERSKLTSAGWQMRVAGEGPLLSVTASGGNTFANGETIAMGNGGAAGVLTITANATGNIGSVAVTSGGRFVNGSVITYTFQRQKHLLSITVGVTPTGYNNTDVIVASNGIVNGAATILTNSTGGFVTANLTLTNVGLWANNVANNTVVITALAANGAASNGTSATFTANLVTSAGGAVNTTSSVLGGRAGRVTYETLVAAAFKTASNTSTLLPS
jgi:hypothetical protein